MKIPFAEWLPDLGDTNNPGATVATNVVPALDGYRPLSSLQSVTLTSVLTAYARGGISVKTSAGVSYVYAGDATKLYRLTVPAAWTDASRLAGGAYATATADMWEFVQWGEMVLATNYTDAPQQITVGGANFAVLAGSPPKARHIAVVRDFVVLANLNDGTERTRTIRWSGFGDEEAWTTSALNQCGSQELPGGGRIVRVIGGERGVVFSEYAITLMTYEGPPTTFRFDQISNERGALCPGGVVDGGGAIFFIGLDDFYLLQGNSVTPIGASKVARTFFTDLQEEYTYRISGAIDKRRSLVVWSYPGAQALSGQPNKLILYHWPSGKWASGEVEVNALYSFLSPGFTLEGLDDISTSLDALTASLDAYTWQGGALSLGGFNSTHFGVTFTGSPLTAQIETTEIQQEGRVTHVSSALPIVEGSGTTTIQHGHRYKPNASPTYEAAVSEDSIGEYPMRKVDRFHRFRVNISGEWTKAKEIQVTIKDAGRR